MDYQFHDGGRAAAGFKGTAGDCVARALTIATARPYREIYDRLAEGNATQRASKHCKKRSRSANNGVFTGRKWFKDYMAELGFKWTPTMQIGQGCTVHMRADELPGGVLIVRASRHMCAVIDGVAYDNHDPRRDGTRCVYGYWKLRT